MADTTFSAGTVISSSWLNDVNTTSYRDFINVQHHSYGAVGNGIVDDTAAIQAAIDAAAADKNRTVFFPVGIYKLSGVVTIPQGIALIGSGSQGSNEAYGTAFIHYANTSCFRWDGGGVAYAGTGGGLQNALILKADGYSGGNAIEVVATSDSQRPGEMFFQNVLAYGLSTGRWERGAVFDGTAANTPGTRGIRSVHFIKCRFADVTTSGETIVLNQVTHFFANGISADPGSGSTAGLYIKGINDGIYLNGCGIAGNVLIIADDADNSTNNFHYEGKFGGTFINNDTQVDGTVRASRTSAATVLVNKSADLKCTTNINPAWLLTNSANITNVTGDATVYDVSFDTEQTDQGNLIAVPASSVTIYCAGYYTLAFSCSLAGVASGHTRGDVSITCTGSATQVFTAVSNPGVQIDPSGNYGELIVAPTVKLEYGDVVKCQVSVSNSTKVVDVVGAAGTNYTYFSGHYIPT